MQWSHLERDENLRCYDWGIHIWQFSEPSNALIQRMNQNQTIQRHYQPGPSHHVHTNRRRPQRQTSCTCPCSRIANPSSIIDTNLPKKVMQKRVSHKKNKKTQSVITTLILQHSLLPRRGGSSPRPSHSRYPMQQWANRNRRRNR